MNGNLTQLANFIRFPQFESISHKFTVRRGGIFLRPSCHVVNIFIKARDAGGMRWRAKGRGDPRSGSQAGDSSGSLGPTGSAPDHRVSNIPTWNHFSPPAAARQTASCALATWPEEESP